MVEIKLRIKFACQAAKPGPRNPFLGGTSQFFARNSQLFMGTSTFPETSPVGPQQQPML
jgi:hypothetical protein